MTTAKEKSIRKNPGERNLIDAIRPGDNVTIVDRFGKERRGRAVIFNAQHHSWTLNMGGAHGTPAVATNENVTRVSPSKRKLTGAMRMLSGYRGNPRRVKTSGEDRDAAYELELYAMNDSDLYRQQLTPIRLNLLRKYAAGKYDSLKAPKLWEYLMESAAQKYVKENGGGHWFNVFTVETRRYAAKQIASEFERQMRAGEWDHLIVEKGGVHAKRLAALRANAGMPRQNPRKKNPDEYITFDDGSSRAGRTVPVDEKTRKILRVGDKRKHGGETYKILSFEPPPDYKPASSGHVVTDKGRFYIGVIGGEYIQPVRAVKNPRKRTKGELHERVTLNRLRLMAMQSTKNRGHEIKWDLPAADSRGPYQHGECKRCGRTVTIIVNPWPNEIDIGGEAVALNCDYRIEKAKTAMSEPAGRMRSTNPAPKPEFVIVASKNGRRFYFDASRMRFVNNGAPSLYATVISAERRAKSLLGNFPILRRGGYKITVEGAGSLPKHLKKNPRGRKKNPSLRHEAEIEAAAKLQADFSGHEPVNVDTMTVPENKVFTPVGKLAGVLYDTTRDGTSEKYIHKFRRKSRPLLLASSDGTELRIAGGRFRFTEAGIEDK